MISKCPCMECDLFTGDYEDTGNGLHIVYCDDGQTRCTTLDAGCSYFEGGAIKGVEVKS